MSTRYILSNTAAKRENEDYLQDIYQPYKGEEGPLSVVDSINCHFARSFVTVGSTDVAYFVLPPR
jgi:hypothetical protein